MKKLTLLTAAFIVAISCTYAQTADEIVENYFENTGGYDNWGELNGVQMNLMFSQGGMEIPVEVVQLSDGRQYTKINVQGNNFMQGVYDGTVLWNTNFQTLKPEKADAEATAMQELKNNDFPQDLYNYKDKGYELELMGTETVEGTETYKLKLTKEPITVDGTEVADVVYYFFDTEEFIPIAQETEVKAGPQKGIMSIITFSDYQEVDGLYFPFSMNQGIKDGPTQPITIQTIKLNPEVEDSVFTFPNDTQEGN